jgi:hypothetical protein
MYSCRSTGDGNAAVVHACFLLSFDFTGGIVGCLKGLVLSQSFQSRLIGLLPGPGFGRNFHLDGVCRLPTHFLFGSFRFWFRLPLDRLGPGQFRNCGWLYIIYFHFVLLSFPYTNQGLMVVLHVTWLYR